MEGTEKGFCERCGRSLDGSEYVCPECGAALREMPRECIERPGIAYLLVPFVISAVLCGMAAWYFGAYMLFLCLFFWFGGRPRTKLQMALKGISLGLLVGCTAGLAASFFLESDIYVHP